MSLLRIAYIRDAFSCADKLQSRLDGLVEILVFNDIDNLLDTFSTFKESNIDAVLLCGQLVDSTITSSVIKIRQFVNLKFIPLVIISETINFANRKLAFKYQVDDLFYDSIQENDFMLRMNFLVLSKKRIFDKKYKELTTAQDYKVEPEKRIFDIVFSLGALILLLPVILVIAALIKISSKGPVFYASKRVGTGYRIFDFYKFRSMMPDADKRLKDMKHLNQYKNEKGKINYSETLCSECIEKEISCQAILFKDGDVICEKIHKRIQKDLTGSAFIKIKGDPRVTKIGKFIRDTSIDELPQLFNVLIGDMSIVGNRPLPMYEAEKITTDKFITRFLAPAGITGLWQVNKRGKGKMSEEERIELDNIYANTHCFKGDIMIILKTIPALFQKESV